MANKCCLETAMHRDRSANLAADRAGLAFPDEAAARLIASIAVNLEKHFIEGHQLPPATARKVPAAAIGRLRSAKRRTQFCGRSRPSRWR